MKCVYLFNLFDVIQLLNITLCLTEILTIVITPVSRVSVYGITVHWLKNAGMTRSILMKCQHHAVTSLQFNQDADELDILLPKHIA